MTPDELSRYLAVLNDLVRQKGITRRELDSRLGWKGGVVARLLRGERGDLRLSQLLAILKELDVEPLAFYNVVHAGTPTTARLLSRLSGGVPPPLVIPPTMTEEEFSQRVREAVEAALAAHHSRLADNP